MTAQPFALIDADFADGNYTFGLTWPLAAEWEKTTDRSLYATLINIMRSGFAQLQDTRELIRLGLIGGGMAPTDALRMVRLYVEERPAAENFGLVVKIVDAFFHGKGVPDADDEAPAPSMAKVQGWDRLKRRLQKIPKAVREQTQPAITSAAQDVADVMKALAPVNDGDLKESIVVTAGGQRTPPHSQPGGATTVPENAAMITAGNSKVRYAHLVEFGTRAHINGGQFAGTKNPGSRAQPYFFSGFRLAQKKAAAKIKRAMSKAVRSKKK